jgi:hypothetical protein
VAYGAFAEALAHWQASRVSAILAVTAAAEHGHDRRLARLRPCQHRRRKTWARWATPGAVLVVLGSAMCSLLGDNTRRVSPPATQTERA